MKYIFKNYFFQTYLIISNLLPIFVYQEKSYLYFEIRTNLESKNTFAAEIMTRENNHSNV